MAAIAHGIVQQLTNQTTMGWVTALTCPAANFVAGGKYLILVTAQLGAVDVTTNVYQARTLHGATTFTGSHIMVNPYDDTPATHRHPYVFMTVFDQPGVGAEDIHFQFRTNAALQPAHADTMQIFYMRLDDDLVDGTDYKYAEDDDSGAPTALTVAKQSFASITFTPANAGDDWLILACPLGLMDVLTIQNFYRINRDAGTEVVPECGQEPSHDAEKLLHTLARVYNLTAAAHTFTIEGWDSAAVAPQNKHYYSSIFALRLNAFQDHEFFWNAAEHTLGAPTTWEETGNIDLVCSVAADFLTLAVCGSNPNAEDLCHAARIQVDGVTRPTGSDIYYDTGSFDVEDMQCDYQMVLGSYGVGAVDLDMDAYVSNVGLVTKDRSLVTFSMELAGGGPPPSSEGYGVSMSSIGC